MTWWRSLIIFINLNENIMRVENLIAVRLSHTKLPFLVAFKIVREARKYRVSSIYESILRPMELWKVAVLLNKLNKENE